MARIIELNYYAIKGCGGTSVCDAVLTTAGLTHDRSFMVIDVDGVYRSQRRSPRLALIHPELSRLVRVPPEHDRVTSGETPGTASVPGAIPSCSTDPRADETQRSALAARRRTAISDLY